MTAGQPTITAKGTLWSCEHTAVSVVVVRVVSASAWTWLASGVTTWSGEPGDELIHGSVEGAGGLKIGGVAGGSKVSEDSPGNHGRCAFDKRRREDPILLSRYEHHRFVDIREPIGINRFDQTLPKL